MNRTLEAVRELGRAIHEIGQATVRLALALDKNIKEIPPEVLNDINALTTTINNASAVTDKLIVCFKLDYLTDKKEIN